MNTDTIFRTILALIVATIAGCGASESDADEDTSADVGNGDSGTTDTGEESDGPETPDDGTDVAPDVIPDTATDTTVPDATETGTDATDTGSAEVEIDVETDAVVVSDTQDAADAAEVCDYVAIASDALGLVGAVTTGTVVATVDGDVTTLVIDASAGGTIGAASNPYIYVDLADAAAVAISDVDAITSADWDIAFKRSTIRINGGNSGPGVWLATRVDETTFEALVSPPGRDAVWTTDTFIDETCELLTEGRDTPVTAFGIWYNYDPATHTVSPPEATTWVLYNRTTHAVMKIGIDSWESGVFTIRTQTL
jgi:plastocyanin